MPTVTRSQMKMNTNNTSVNKPSVNKVSNTTNGNYKYASHSEFPKALSVKMNRFCKYTSNMINDIITNENIYSKNGKYESTSK